MQQVSVERLKNIFQKRLAAKRENLAETGVDMGSLQGLPVTESTPGSLRVFQAQDRFALTKRGADQKLIPGEIRIVSK
jgi:hypothetical protein